MFRVTKKSSKSKVRAGIVKTMHGSFQTPAFMPIATKGAVKTLDADDVRSLGAGVILSNTYHQLLRPGVVLLKKAGGLHSFMDWRGPMLTDSGGFQVFSLAKIRKILPNGVRFRSHIDGTEFMLTPEKALEIQQAIGSDIRMVLDVCAPYPCTRREAEDAVVRTTAWAAKSAALVSKYRIKKNQPSAVSDGQPSMHPLFFAIVQGSTYRDLRIQSARELVALDFDGYAVGGLAVGEPRDVMMEVLDNTIPELPEGKPRYLMGVGYPEQIVGAVKRGIDLFDCVIPTREARHGRLYIWKKNKTLSEKKTWYEAGSITNSRYAKRFSPINPHSRIPALRTYTWAYMHHLFRVGEPLGQRLATLNNVEFYLTLMERVRAEVKKGSL